MNEAANHPSSNSAPYVVVLSWWDLPDDIRATSKVPYFHITEAFEPTLDGLPLFPNSDGESESAPSELFARAVASAYSLICLLPHDRSLMPSALKSLLIHPAVQSISFKVAVAAPADLNNCSMRESDRFDALLLPKTVEEAVEAIQNLSELIENPNMVGFDAACLKDTFSGCANILYFSDRIGSEDSPLLLVERITSQLPHNRYVKAATWLLRGWDRLDLSSFAEVGDYLETRPQFKRSSTCTASTKSDCTLDSGLQLSLFVEFYPHGVSPPERDSLEDELLWIPPFLKRQSD